MKTRLAYIAAILLFSFNAGHSQSSGEATFKSICAACHTIGKGRLVGPDLSHVYDRMSADWLQKFIRSSQTVVKSGDTAAIAIFRQYNQIVMPDNNLSPAQITGVIEYIKNTDLSAAAAPPMTTPEKPAGQASQSAADTTGMQYKAEFVPSGLALFTGQARFVNGASPCNVCHNIRSESLIGGGRIGIDLTAEYTTVGPQGINAILTAPPFPVMKRALLNHNLTEDEKRDLISLFKSFSEQPPELRPHEPGMLLFFVISIITGSFFVVFLYVAYNDRKIP